MEIERNRGDKSKGVESDQDWIIWVHLKIFLF